MKSSNLFFLLIFSLILQSCNDKGASENQNKEKEDFIKIEAKSLSITNSFLNSIEQESTRGIGQGLYPEYYGGYYISNERIPVFLVVDGMENEAITDINKRTESDYFLIEKCENSYNDLNRIILELRDKFMNPSLEEKINSLGWIGQYIDVKQNLIIVELEDISGDRISKFKELIQDSPLIEFIHGEETLLQDNKKKSSQSLSNRSTNLNLGGAFYVPTFGEGSIGYRVSHFSGGKGFVTCGHVISSGVTAKLYNNGPTIGYCYQSITNGVDAAYVEVNSPYALTMNSAYRNNLLNNRVIILGKNDYVQKEGCATYHSAGNVTEVGYDTTFTTPFGARFRATNLTVCTYNSTTGDSGGVTYSLTNSIAGIHMGSGTNNRHYYVTAGNINTALGVSMY